MAGPMVLTPVTIVPLPWLSWRNRLPMATSALSTDVLLVARAVTAALMLDEKVADLRLVAGEGLVELVDDGARAGRCRRR